MGPETKNATPPYHGVMHDYSVDRHYLLTETRDHSIIVFQEQYRSLREEILQRQQRRFLIVLGGILGIPGLSGLSISGSLSGNVVYVAPVLVVAISYLFILENNSIARAGHFIEMSIENHFRHVPGWEHYLHDLSDNYLKNPPANHGAQNSFKILLLVYYISAVIISISQFQREFPEFADVLSVLYFLAASLLLIHWLWTTRNNLTFSAQLQKKGKERRLR